MKIKNILSVFLIVLSAFVGKELNSQSTTIPYIEHIKWGEVTIKRNNEELKYRDVKLWPDNSKEWNWNETGTRHVPGIQVADLAEFIDHVDCVVLTKGMDLVLQIPQETLDYIKNKGKALYTGQTTEMVEIYNQLIKEGKRVGGLFHSTC